MPSPSTDREALIAILAEQAQSGGAHEGPEPEPEELLDYLEGRLAPEAAQRLERMLVASPEAARALLDVAELEAAGETDGQRPAELSVLAGWRELKGRLHGASSRSGGLIRLLPSIAAALLVANIGLLGLVGSLRKDLSEMQRPRIVDLYPHSRAGREEIFKASAGPLVLVIETDHDCPTYTAELQGPSSEDRQTFELPKPDEKEPLTLQGHFEPGTYHLRLFGCQPRHRLEEYSLRVNPAHAH